MRALSLLAVLALLLAVVAVWFSQHDGARFPAGLVSLAPDTAPDRLAAREAGIDPDQAARIIWAGEEGQATPLVILYLHGFSASPEEIRPVPDDVAAALGANLLLWRLTGHGQDGAALGDARLNDWQQDFALGLTLATELGDRVIVMGTSTGGTLAAWAARQQGFAEHIAAVVMISPNFRVQSPSAWLLDLPLARIWAPWVAGQSRCFEAHNADHARFWTSCYPTRALIPMAQLVRIARGDYAAATAPLLILADPRDSVVDPEAARRVAQSWGGPATFTEITTHEGDDPDHHVIAGRILSPRTTPEITARIIDWLRETVAP